ncbi:5-methylthioribose kinase [Nakamurella sp. UYEF19]|uniref:hypothetical protein n=1 Tax=Nakamurella sp. UYEF19 TaxID=1756392 RepID=UPI003399EC78
MSDIETPYRELNLSTVAELVVPFLAGRPITAQEIGDGNLNRVFRVSSSYQSVVIEQALPYLKAAGESWPLARHRARIECEALQQHGKLVGQIPSAGVIAGGRPCARARRPMPQF